MAKILFFGDSITAYRKNFISASEFFAETFPQHEIVNKGVGGNDTNLAKERFQKDVLDEKPDMVIFCFGCNDAAIDVFKQKTVPRLTIEEYVENLRYFVHEIRAIGAEMIFWTTPPMVLVDGLKPYYGGEPYTSNGFNFMLDQFIEAACKLMEEEKIKVVHINRVFKELTGNDETKLVELLPDGMHPNTEGQKIIFRELNKAFANFFN
jgi:lysophospholipase L1-like esterase